MTPRIRALLNMTQFQLAEVHMKYHFKLSTISFITL